MVSLTSEVKSILDYSEKKISKGNSSGGGAMGRLKAGESLYKPPPLPKAARFNSNSNSKTKTKSPPSRTRRKRPKLNLYKRKKQKQKQEEKNEEGEGDVDVTMTRTIEDEMEEETNSNNDDNVVVTVAVGATTGDVSGENTGPLSLLRKFPNNSYSNNNNNSNNLNQLAPATRELYAKTAESLKKLLVSELSSWSGDVETMVASANRALETLDWLQPDCTEFYDAVRDLLSRRAQLSSLETELRTHQNEEESDAGDFQARSKDALEALARSEAEYKKAGERVSCVKSRVSEIRVVLKKLEDESKREEVMLVDRKREWDQCIESHLAIKKEEKELAEQMEEKQKIKRLRDEAEAAVQGSIKALSSLC
ncbi:uncharacterized protein LOC112012944 [Quercus suber]|uniref:uncharacterized protein LOC112012944 n=1 Tax=Quercus suber TaxID=58331 RepID=UPI000CE1BD69|nr:calponin homology domain-containing protein DDB_G0272472-like [Quercus suber]